MKRSMMQVFVVASWIYLLTIPAAVIAHTIWRMILFGWSLA